MNTEEFVKLCYTEKEHYLDTCFKKQQFNHKANLLIDKMNLTTDQISICKDLVNTILTDAYMTLLYGLDGAASIGGIQMPYSIKDEEDNVISDGTGDLEAYAYQFFHNNGKQ